METDTQFKQPDSLPGGPEQARVGPSKPAGRTDMGTETMSGIPDMVTDTIPGIPIRNV